MVIVTCNNATANCEHLYAHVLGHLHVRVHIMVLFSDGDKYMYVSIIQSQSELMMSLNRMLWYAINVRIGYSCKHGRWHWKPLIMLTSINYMTVHTAISSIGVCCNYSPLLTLCFLHFSTTPLGVFSGCCGYIVTAIQLLKSSVGQYAMLVD